MEAVIAKNSAGSAVWKWLVENNQIIACVFLLGHNVWWWFDAPTVFNTVTYCAVCTFLAAIAPRRWMMWAWLVLMLSMSAVRADMLSPQQVVVTSKPTVVFCGNCEQ